MSKRCLAIAEEWRNNLHQFSYCYSAHVLEDQGVTALTEEDIDDSLEHIWVNTNVAMELMNGAKPTSILDFFFVEKFTAALESPAAPNHLWY